MKSFLFTAWFGCVIGNYLWQYFNNQEWVVAFERSYFQLGPIIVLFLAIIFYRLEFKEREE